MMGGAGMTREQHFCELARFNIAMQGYIVHGSEAGFWPGPALARGGPPGRPGLPGARDGAWPRRCTS